MEKNSKDYSDLKKEIVMNIITSYESRERLVLLSEIKNEENEEKVERLLDLSSKINQNSRNVLNLLNEADDIDNVPNLKEELLDLTQYYKLLIQEIF
jgi:hypothetical protein